MKVQVKVLVKGVQVRDGKDKTGNKVQYHNVNLYGVDGRAMDFTAFVDMSNGGPALFQKAQKLEYGKAMASIDVFTWEKQAKFQLLDIAPLA